MTASAGTTRAPARHRWEQSFEEEMAGRIRSLSSRELQIALLTAEGMRPVDIAESLGISRGTVLSTRQAIRRKLAMPPRIALEPLLAVGALSRQLRESRPAPTAARSDRAAGGGAPGPAEEKRRHLELRQTLAELEGLIARSAKRADILRGLAASGVDDAEGLAWQAGMLDTVTTRLAESHEWLVRRARGG